MSAEVLFLDVISRDDNAVAGGKGANLGELLGAGMPVPPGFAVTTAAYQRHLEQANLNEKLAALLAGLDSGGSGEIGALAGEAQALILARSLDSETQVAIGRAYERLGEGLVAVRSSATAEDTEEASFAGQQSTYLNIFGAGDVIDAVAACWASLFEVRAIDYRARCGFDHMACSMAVIVQGMVQATRSGVAFTCDPVSHADQTIVIEAVRGLGEALVSGEVTPDMYVVDKATLTVLERTVVEQKRELAHGGGTGLQTNAWRDVPNVQRTRPKLDDGEIARLAAIARRVEEHYGRPQDIEWAEADGEFYIVQSRPVTTLQHTH